MADNNINDDASQVEKKEDKKAAKAAKKEAKKAAKEAKKKAKKNGEVFEDEDDEQAGSKIVVVFVTAIIIVVWLAILALIIKADVGGFGSSIMTPILKDVPYINKILPSSAIDSGSVSISDEEAGYDTLEEALDRIKELELLLQEAQNNESSYKSKIDELKTEVARLKKFEEEQKNFEEEKLKFDEEVVFNDKAPDIKEYQEYYESIDPTNAELIYKEVLEQQELDSEIEDYVAMYSNMKASEAASIFNEMTGNLKLVAKILKNMDADTSSAILGKMDTDIAAKLTVMMDPE